MRLVRTFRKAISAPRGLVLPLCFAPVTLLGCHSPYINATVENRTGGPISPVEVDYPSASFGIPALASGATYTYRFKILGSGATKVVWTDAAEHEHTYGGPSLREGQEGSLTILLHPAGATWMPSFQP